MARSDSEPLPISLQSTYQTRCTICRMLPMHISRDGSSLASKIPGQACHELKGGRASDRAGMSSAVGWPPLGSTTIFAPSPISPRA